MMKLQNFWKKIDVRGWMIGVFCYVYAVLSERLPKKCISLKIMLIMLQMTRTFNIVHEYGPKFEKNFCLKIYHQRARIYVGPRKALFSSFEAYVNPSALVEDFQTKVFLKFWSILMKYIVSPGHLKHYKHDF